MCKMYVSFNHFVSAVHYEETDLRMRRMLS
jgi:hypothetical protein